MRHCDPETLALLALGDGSTGGSPGASTEATAEDRAHLDACPECRAELAALAQVVRTGRAGGPGADLVAPPPSVWLGIAAETGVDPALLRQTPFVPARRGWARRTALVAAAAALVGVVAGGTGAWLLTRNSTSAQRIVATATLKPLSAPSANGTAVVSSATTGTGSPRELTVRVSGLTESPGTFYEVWLLDRQAGKLVSLGVLGHGETGTFQIPAGLDLGQYPVVDVSLQRLDGNPKHSGNSVVRGLLG